MKKYYKYLVLLFCFISILISICFVPISASKLIPIIEKQVEKDLGVKVHIDKLVLRVGPYFKIKTPIMHIMYNDGQKFAQFDNVRFHISILAVFKDNPEIFKIRADKLTLRLNSDDKFLNELLVKLNEKSFNSNPIVALNSYKISYNNRLKNDIYTIEGQDLELTKIRNFKNYKLKTKGDFSINSQKYISYDLNIVPYLELPALKSDFNIIDVFEQLKEVDFHSDIIADLKLYKNNLDLIQASGFINVDNLSVLDKLKKNPKSFIYLTLWGDKASVLSNIYTSQTKKIYLEGSLNNSQKPVLDLKVKTDDIELNDLYKKLKVITYFSNLKNINNLKGTLNANFTLKGDVNKIKSNGFMKLNNASIEANGVVIDRINSEIDFNNNVINIIKAIGYVNNSPILAKGKLDKEIDIELLMNKVELKHLLPESIGVKSGIISVVTSLKGQLKNITHKENIHITNFKYSKNDIDVVYDSFKIDTNKNNTAIINNIICKNKYTETIKIPTFKFEVEKDYIRVNNTNIYMPNSQLVFNGDISNYLTNLTFNTNLTGFINSRDIISFDSTISRYPFKLSINGNSLLQNINLQLFVENTSILDEPFALNFISKLEKNALKIDDFSILSYEGKDYKNYKLNLKAPKKLIVSGIIEDLKNPLLKNLRIFIPQQLNIHLFDTLLSLKGDIFVNNKIKTPEIVGQLNIANLINQELQLTVSNLNLDFNRNNIAFNSPIIKIGDSAVNITGNIINDFSNGIKITNLNLHSKYINTDTLLMYKDNLIFKNFDLIINNCKLYAEKLLLNLYNNEVYLSAFTSDMALEDNIITFKNISTETYNGKIAGTVKFNLRDEHFDANLMGRGISASPIFNIISSRKDTISGTMDFDTNLTGEIISKQSLNGKIKFIINNGRMSTLGKLEHLLYAQNVVADNMLRTSLSVVTKAITLKDTGLFKYLRGDLILENGIANINLLQSQGPLMALFIKGRYNPINDHAQLLVLGRLSDEIITGLGAFGDFSFNKLLIMLTGEESKYKIMPEDFDKIPQLAMKNTKEFRSIINGIIDKPSSVILFNWISYSQKSLKQKEIPTSNTDIPKFVEELPY